MAAKKKIPRLRGLSPDEAKLHEKERKKVWAQGQHTVKFNDEVWVKWTEVKEKLKFKTNNEVAMELMNSWTSIGEKQIETQLHVPGHSEEKTPHKGTAAQTRFSTPGVSSLPPPDFEPVSDISEGSESSGNNKLIERYQRKAEEVEGSFIDVTLDIVHDPTDKDKSYQLSDPETDVTEEYDSGEEYDDFDLDMSVRPEGMPEHDLNELPIIGILDDRVHSDGEQDSGEESEDDVPEQQGQGRNLVTEKKSICFERELLQLASLKEPSKCDRKTCTGTVLVSSKYVGSSVKLRWICSNNHAIKTWESQPKIRRTNAGDFLLSAAIPTSGNNFEKVRLLFKFFGLGITSPTTNSQLQTKHVSPIIENTFQEMINENVSKYVGKAIVLAGDGRMDSPGHSAQYCTYTLIEYNSKDIVALEIIDKRMTGLKSTNMEQEGLRRGLNKVLNSGITVAELCTDASTSVASMIKKNYPEIVHSFDTWHGAKNFGKRLASVAAETKNKDLRPWVPDIINHFWYCSRKATGNEDVLLAKWRGALHHVTNVHEWILGDNVCEPKCDHEHIDEHDKQWLEPGGDSHMALTRIMLDVRFLRGLHHYVNFRHTGELETFHEHILMYAAKRFAYVYPTYSARNFLAALDYQFHKDRPVLLNKDGQPRLHRAYSKRNKNWTCYTEKQPKTYGYIESLLNKMIENFRSSDIPLRRKVELTPSDPRTIKRTLAEISPPPTKLLFERKRSRFSDE